MTAPRPCSPAPALLGEGPRWHEERGELLWVDILASRLHRARVGASGRLEPVVTVELDRHVGAVAPAAGGGHVLAAAQGFLLVGADGDVRELAQPEAGNTAVRMNDGACDGRGRFYAGTMAYDESPGAGVLYRLELDGSCTTVLEGLTISNGIDWSPDGRTMYLADSGTRRIEAFEIDPDSGEIGDRRTLVEIDEGAAAPDGLAVDEAGTLWVALWDGAAIRRYAPDGRQLSTLPLPVDRPTSCAFGGPALETLFVTSARHGLDEHALDRQPHAGHVFRVDGLGARGLPCRPYRGLVGRSPGADG